MFRKSSWFPDMNWTAAIAVAISMASSPLYAQTAGGELEVGAMQALSGPMAAAGLMLNGVEARLNMENANGGVGGHKIVLHKADDKFDPAAAPGAARILVEDNKTILFCCSATGTSAAVLPYLRSKKILGISSSGSDELTKSADSPYRSVVTSYGELSAHQIKFAVEKLGVKKIAIAYTPDSLGKPLVEGAKAQLKKMGLKEVALVEFSASSTSMAPVAAKLKESGAEFVAINLVPTTASLLMKAADQIEYKPIYGATFALQDLALVRLMGDAIDGRVYFSSPFADPTSPEAETYVTWVKKLGVEPNSYNLNGWTIGDGIVEVLKAAVRAAGGKVPTRQQVIDATEGLEINTNYIRKVKWTKTNFSGSKAAHVFQLKGGKFVLVSDYEDIQL